MNTMDFIKSSLQALVLRFDFIQCRYEYNELSSTHLIEIECLEDRCDETLFRGIKRNLRKEFIRQFPLDGILFVDETTLSQIKQAQYVFTGTAYTHVQQQWAYTVHEERTRIAANEDCYSGMEFKVSIVGIRSSDANRLSQYSYLIVSNGGANY